LQCVTRLLGDAPAFERMLDCFFDEQPQLFRTDNGPILAVPHPSMEMNDMPAIFNRRMSDAEFATMLIDAFDQQLEDSAKYPLVYSVSLHTFIMGQPHRARSLRRALEHIVARRTTSGSRPRVRSQIMSSRYPVER
jgi:allantoinase